MSTYAIARSIMMEVEYRHEHNKEPERPTEPPTWDFLEAVEYHARGMGGTPIHYCGQWLDGSHLIVHWVEHQYVMINEYPRHWLVWLWYHYGYAELDARDKEDWDLADDKRDHGKNTVLPAPG
jgi:hypothetical protein